MLIIKTKIYYLIPLILMAAGVGSLSTLKYFEPFVPRDISFAQVPKSGAIEGARGAAKAVKKLSLSFDYQGKVYKLALENRLDVVKVGDKFDTFTDRTEKSNKYPTDLLNTFYIGAVDGIKQSHVVGMYKGGEFEGFVFMPDLLIVVEKIYLDKENKITYLAGRTSSSKFGALPANKTIISYEFDSLEALYQTGNRSDFIRPPAPAKGGAGIFSRQEEGPRCDAEEIKAASDTNLKKVCDLHVVIDPTFYIEYSVEYVENALKEVILLVEGMNYIYRTTDFDGDGKADNIGFSIGQLSLYKTFYNPSFKNVALFRERHPDKLIDAAYLSSFSEMFGYHSCLALALTYRDFSGTNGLAYIGSDTSKSGVFSWNERKGPTLGIKPSSLPRTYVIQYHYNTGMINFKRPFKTKRQLRGLSLNTLAHEVGHTFGSVHDEETKCRGTGHVMEAYAPAYSTQKLLTFSRCSCKSIYDVVKGRMCKFKTIRDPLWKS